MDSPALRESFWDYREHFRRVLTQGGVAGEASDPQAEYHAEHGPMPLNEKLIQTIWAQQLIQAGGLRLADGTPLRILDAGRWTGHAGPDFKDARVMIGERLATGDIEIHLDGADWSAHAHERDLEYNRVVLHVVLRAGDGKTHDRLHNGDLVPRLELEPYIFPDLETVRRSLTPDDFQYMQSASAGRCLTLMTDQDPRLVADFLDRAGDERLIAKMQRLDEQARQADLEQVFYQALMTSLGSGSGKTLYYLLAKRTPLTEMADYVRDLPEAQWPAGFEALLLSVGGLLPPEGELAEAPPEARERAAMLRSIWKRLEPYWCDRAIPPTRRWFQGIRPVNFPVRRLAGVAVLLARAMRTGRPLLAGMLERIKSAQTLLRDAMPAKRRHPLVVDLTADLTVAGEGHFWGGHYSFTAKPAARTMDLIGEGAALSLILNALLPAALLAARRAGDDGLADAVVRLYGLIPPLQPNHITGFMTKRLFDDDEHAVKIINTERRRQALFQIFYSCCNAEERHCAKCFYFAGP